ncbi:putative phosphoglycerate mutase [Streptosporangium becharense]|uniref:Putative phosphoglycerate mutase n=1 Tax=Streptosporangium becharense TaxID=1816182 RepID=A0A7W9MKB7_9ACTN|nr:histidine phosphatase family protein [Streptosporangium becharense]MBB2914412.1 putative phosphoglycerate mutase [Streptosporangium becharense]MBB5823556.1 putative phosphoglycerate mutase [Streptosporangium becharense]
MTTRHLYLARHGAADAFGELTGTGRRQASLLGERLAGIPVDAVWHSPLPRAAASAHELARHLPDVPVAEAAELVDHVPYVPSAAETPPSWAGFFDGYDDTEAASGHRLAEALVARFAKAPGTTEGARPGTHDVLVTHACQIAWLVRHALDAPPSRWLGLNSANAALTVIEYRDGLPPTIVMFNDMSHLPPDLRWTGFPAEGVRP